MRPSNGLVGAVVAVIAGLELISRSRRSKRLTWPLLGLFGMEEMGMVLFTGVESLPRSRMSSKTFDPPPPPGGAGVELLPMIETPRPRSSSPMRDGPPFNTSPLASDSMAFGRLTKVSLSMGGMGSEKYISKVKNSFHGNFLKVYLPSRADLMLSKLLNNCVNSMPLCCKSISM